MILGACIALLAGYAIACWLMGENLVATWWYEWWLSRMSMEACDAFCAANPSNSGIVVTLTTIPSRIDAIGLTLKSLLRQTVRPAEIRLCVPEWSQRERCAYLVPAWLGRLRNVTVVPCADEGPATKFLSTLAALDGDSLVVVVDDDRIYHPRLLSEFARLAPAHPNEAIAAAGWSVPADLVDRPTTLRARFAGAPYVPIRGNQLRVPRRVDIMQGLHGYVVRPRHIDLAAVRDFAAAPEAVRFVDDVWISAHLRVPCRVHPLRLGYIGFKPWANRRRFNATSLGANVNRAPRDEDRGNSVALRYFARRWTERPWSAPAPRRDSTADS